MNSQKTLRLSAKVTTPPVVRVNATSYYPLAMCKRWARGLLKAKRLDINQLVANLSQIESNQYLQEACVVKRVIASPKKDETETTDKEFEKSQELLMRIHRKAANCSNSNLQQALRDDRAPQWVIDLAGDLKCEYCQRL